VIHEVSHRTTYRYRQPVSVSHHLLHLAPREAAFQSCGDVAIEISPAPTVRSTDVDYFGNPTTFVTIQQAHTELVFLRQQADGATLFDRVVDTLVRLSQIVVDLPAVRRIAVDPLLATRDRLVVLDAHVDLARVPTAPTPPRAWPSGPTRASWSRPRPCATAPWSACARSGPRTCRP
jgi:hypothetical protein